MKDFIAIDEFRIKKKQELNGVNYVEFYFGSFENSFEYWNEESVYLHHSVYKFFHNVFKRISPRFNDYNVNNLDNEQLELFKECLIISDQIASDKSPSELSRRYDHDGEEIKVKLKGICADLSLYISSNEKLQKEFWILGM